MEDNFFRKKPIKVIIQLILTVVTVLAGFYTGIFIFLLLFFHLDIILRG